MQEHVFLIADACAQWGVEQVVICPGSRSAPLVYAFSSNKKFTCFSVPDERSAAYMALGMAQSSNKPVAIICTSGTASLNLYPAISEAFYRKIPLIALTADRPYHLLNQQDGQMINQQNVFSNNICASFSTPDTDSNSSLMRDTHNVLKQMEQVWQNQHGPLHLNIPLREPLYPVALKKKALAKNKALPEAFNHSSMSDLLKQQIKKTWNESPRKIILIGQHEVDNTLFTSLLPFYQNGDVMIICDVLSNKQRLCNAPHFDFILSHALPETLELLQPDLVVSLGGSMLSKALKNWLKTYKPKHHFRLHQGGALVDTYNHSPVHVSAKAEDFFTLLNNQSDNHLGASCKQLWQELEVQAEAKLQNFIQHYPEAELSIMSQLLNALPDGIDLHLSNSSTVRYASYCARLNPSWVMHGNRGTSGIDGSTSTAVGSALVNNKLTVLITGDLGFLYDRNAFFHQHIPDNLRVIVINNHGGGIFTLIDGPTRQPNQLNYFTTPHHHSAKFVALENNLEYTFTKGTAELSKALEKFLKPNNKAAVLEIDTNMKANQKAFNTFKKIKL